MLGQRLQRSAPRVEFRSFARHHVGLVNTKENKGEVLGKTIVRLVGVLLVFLVLFGTPVFAAPEPAGTSEPTGKAEPQSGAARVAPVVFHNRTVFEMRATLLGYSPAERAEAASHRIAEALDKGGPGVVSTRTTSEGVAVFVDGALVFFVTHGDVNTLVGATLDSTVSAAAENLSKAIDATREGRDLQRLGIALGKSLAATAFFALLLWAIVRGNRWLGARLSTAVEARIEKLKTSGITAVNPGQSLIFTRRLVTLIAWLVGLFALHLWLTFVLVQFPYTRPWGEGLGTFLLHTVASIAHAIVGAVPGLVTVVIIVVITRFLARLAHAFFDQFSEGRVTWGWLDADTAGPTRRVFTVVLWLFALAMAYPYLPGSHTDAFKGLSVLVGVMISLGASNLVGQAASGLILIYSRALKPGEFVKIGETQGTVTELGMFATRIETGMGEEVVLPNSFVLSNTTKNYSRATDDEGYVMDVTVTIGYSTPWRQVHAMLLEAARRTNGIRPEPKPYVIQTALSDFYVGYRLVAYGAPEAPKRRAQAMNDLHANVQDVFNHYGVQITSPHYVVDPPRPQIVPPERWYEPPAIRPSDMQTDKKE